MNSAIFLAQSEAWELKLDNKDHVLQCVCVGGSPGERELELENQRVARTWIVSGVPDGLEIGLQFDHRGELKNIGGLEAELVLVEDSC